MPDPDVIVGATYAHPSGLKVRVLDQHVPGDRDDALRVWCEVVQVPERGNGSVGDRGGWCLLEMFGWTKET